MQPLPQVIHKILDIVIRSFWDTRAQHVNPAQAKVYLFTIDNKCLNHLRDIRKFDEEDVVENKWTETVFINQLKQEEFMKYLHQVIDWLPAQTGKIIRLTLKGLTNEEIGPELGISVDTVKTLKENGYKKLKESSLRHLYMILILEQ